MISAFRIGLATSGYGLLLLYVTSGSIEYYSPLLNHLTKNEKSSYGENIQITWLFRFEIPGIIDIFSLCQDF